RPAGLRAEPSSRWGRRRGPSPCRLFRPRWPLPCRVSNGLSSPTARAVDNARQMTDDFAEPLREEDVDLDPVAQFQVWFAAAADAGLRMPEAAAVAPATNDGTPSVRMVLVKQVDVTGFVFYTNYESRKAHELAVNPSAALLFYWDALGR